MKCINCGTENRETALFCKECGSKITKEETKTDSGIRSEKSGGADLSKKKKCINCGMENGEMALFCKKCGNELPKKEEKPRERDLPKKRICGQCGTENKEGALFCKKCGNALLKKSEEKDSETMYGKTEDVNSPNWFFQAGDL